jgi:hypothetical protein
MSHDRHQHELSAPLAQLLQSVAAVPEAATAAAQERLLTRLPQASVSARPARRAWLLAAASGVATVLTLALLPLFSEAAGAFAAVQTRLRNFNTMVLQVTQRAQGKIVQSSTITVDALGVVRTDIGQELSVIVDPPRGRVLTLLHQPKQALVSTIAISSAQSDSNGALSWLDDVRNFQGKATAIATPRLIDGRKAYGWTLPARGSQLELWVDAQGWPVSMHMAGAAQMDIDYRFAFDRALPANTLSSEPPAGYTMVVADKD